MPRRADGHVVGKVVPDQAVLAHGHRRVAVANDCALAEGISAKGIASGAHACGQGACAAGQPETWSAGPSGAPEVGDDVLAHVSEHELKFREAIENAGGRDAEDVQAELGRESP